MFRFEQLEIWNESRKIASDVYTLTKTWPRSELFGLTSQIRRSAGSISANIAEGSGSRSKKEFGLFLGHSIKSLFETVSHLYIALDQQYITKKQMEELYSKLETLAKRISSFRRSL